MSNVPAARTLNETLKMNYDILNMQKMFWYVQVKILLNW